MFAAWDEADRLAAGRRRPWSILPGRGRGRGRAGRRPCLVTVFNPNFMHRQPPRGQPVRASTACTARCQASQAASAAAPARSAAMARLVQPPPGLLARRPAAVLGRGAGAAQHRLRHPVLVGSPRAPHPAAAGLRPARSTTPCQRRPPRRIGRQPLQDLAQRLQAAAGRPAAGAGSAPHRCRASAAAPGRRARHPMSGTSCRPSLSQAKRSVVALPSSMASGRRPKSPSAATAKTRRGAVWRGRSSTSRPLAPRGSMASAVSSRSAGADRHPRAASRP